MKKTILLAGGAVLLAAAVSVFVYVKNGSNNSMSELFCSNVEALTWCEIDGKIIKAECEGNEGTCTITKYGHTLTCNGRQTRR